MSKQKNEIDKILHQGQIQDIIEILEKEVQDCFIIYVDKDGKIRVRATVNYLEALGMLDMGKDIVH